MWNPFKPITDYASMLSKIGVFTFAALLVAVGLLYTRLQWVNDLLTPIALPIESEDIPFSEVPFGVLLVAVLVAILSRICKLHDRLSDLLGIRRRFDVQEILLPLAAMSDVSLSYEQIEKLNEERNRLMSKTFYCYASSTPDKCKIDQHYVTMALDQWSWYWILLEANAVFVVTAALFALSSDTAATSVILICSLLAIGLQAVLRGLCVKYARQQVREIMSIANHRAEVSGVFRAL